MGEQAKRDDKTRWEEKQVRCPEGKHTANLLIEWSQEGGQPVLKGISCDNPRLSDLDNWDCRWSCWEKIQRQLLG